jgi:hypothetical protein
MSVLVSSMLQKLRAEIYRVYAPDWEHPNTGLTADGRYNGVVSA